MIYNREVIVIIFSMTMKIYPLPITMKRKNAPHFHFDNLTIPPPKGVLPTSGKPSGLMCARRFGLD
ncbi:unnamed protein product [Amoebophrya sp. A25]|nr:unnamed protein product [Amoebophrya sp. A25]|eukprot:GSA25T00000524001.1